MRVRTGRVISDCQAGATWNASPVKSRQSDGLRPVASLRRLRQTVYFSLVRRLVHRPRRLRRSPALRNLVRETQLSAHDFVLAAFVSEKLERRQPIASMPGVFQLSLKEIVDEAQRAQDLGLQAVLLFGIPEKKTNRQAAPTQKTGSFKRRCEPSNQNVRTLVTITDVCLVRIHEPRPLRCHARSMATISTCSTTRRSSFWLKPRFPTPQPARTWSRRAI